MKVLLINGSPHEKGNTYVALHEMEKVFSQEGVETELLHVGGKSIRGCLPAALVPKRASAYLTMQSTSLHRNLKHATEWLLEARFITLLQMRR